MDLWKYSLRNGNADWVILLLLMAAHLRDGARPPHRPRSVPQNHRASGRRARHESLAGRRPRG